MICNLENCRMPLTIKQKSTKLKEACFSITVMEKLNMLAKHSPWLKTKRMGTEVQEEQNLGL